VFFFLCFFSPSLFFSLGVKVTVVPSPHEFLKRCRTDGLLRWFPSLFPFLPFLSSFFDATAGIEVVGQRQMRIVGMELFDVFLFLSFPLFTFPSPPSWFGRRQAGADVEDDLRNVLLMRVVCRCAIVRLLLFFLFFLPLSSEQ